EHFHYSSLSLTRPPPTSTLFPYPTLFRSRHKPGKRKTEAFDLSAAQSRCVSAPRLREIAPTPPSAGRAKAAAACAPMLHGAVTRSEEHTSELQSRENLVCRLLLEKKKGHA